MKLSIVMPLYNERRHIASVLKEISKYKLPIVVVDDGSTDGSGKIVHGLKATNITLLSHKVNLGKGAALKTGAEYAFGNGADAIIFMDSDGQHLASDLPRFIQVLKSRKYGVIFGSRNLNMGVPLVRYLGNKIASVVIGLLFGVYVSDSICGFKGLTKKGYQQVKWESNGYGVETEIVARVGKFKVKHFEVPVGTVYHDKAKGVTLLDAFGILGEVVKWRLTI
jgi:glycosyltransferase involved in cell wall biosynthesis